jgi:predicted DNA-binding transcriptional regulator AlpA
MIPPDEILCTKGVSRRTGIAVNTWERWRSDNKGPPVLRCGRAVRYSWSAVLEWMKKGGK